MKNKKFLLTLFFVGIITLLVVIGSEKLLSLFGKPVAADVIATREVAQEIAASGSIHSQQEVTLHFQTGGKVVYLPFKQGDTVSEGQTIAQLDTYILQRSLATALNNYRLTRDVFDQTQQNAGTNVLQTQQQANFPGIQADKTNAINDAVKRILDESQGTLDNSVINVELANYAQQLASLTAPFSGILTQEDITTPNVNVTTATSFSLADPSQKVFRADVGASDIDFVSVGAKATVKLDGQNTSLSGSVVAIYPQKKILGNGEQVYDVDIQVDGLPDSSVFGQNGSVLIVSNNQTKALMVPSWTIVGHTAIWVWNGKTALLKPVTIGKSHGAMTEIVSGLSPEDKVIIAPKEIVKQTYSML